MQRLRAGALALALAVLGLTPAGVRAARAGPPTAEALYAAYAAGDYDVVRRELHDRQAFGAMRGPLLSMAADWITKSRLSYWNAKARQLTTTPDTDVDFSEVAKANWRKFWTPQHVAFLLEVGIVAYEGQYPEPGQFVDAARELVVHRPAQPGTKPAEDQFELTFHRAVLGTLVGFDKTTAALQYLDDIEPRVFPTPAPDGQPPRLVDLRPVMDCGMLLERQTKEIPMEPGRAGGPPAVRDVPGFRKPLSDAATAYAQAAQDADEFAEACVRRAFILFRIGQPAQAVALLDQLDGHAAEPTVRYWGWLIRGRALEGLTRLPEARIAYTEAGALFQDAQTPKLARAALALRLGLREDAWRDAAAARATPDRPVDPWWQYWFGDLRHLPAWMRAMREARP